VALGQRKVMSAVTDGIDGATWGLCCLASSARSCTAAHKGNSNFWENYGDKKLREESVAEMAQ